MASVTVRLVRVLFSFNILSIDIFKHATAITLSLVCDLSVLILRNVVLEMILLSVVGIIKQRNLSNLGEANRERYSKN